MLLDIDGTLAPIAPRPEDARVPEETRAEVARLAEPLRARRPRQRTDRERTPVAWSGSKASATSRPPWPGGSRRPDADRWRDELHAFASGVDWPVEDKGLTVSFHYRQAEDEVAALEYLEEVAEKARR